MNARMPHAVAFPFARGNRQRGAVLFIALIVLVAMTLAGLALMRSVDTGNLIAGNLAFRNSATSAGDAGLESARGFLMGKTPGDLEKDADKGYYANWQEQFDPKTFNFPTLGTTVGADPLGNNLYYVVHRMCKESNKSIDATDCVKVTSVSVGSTKGGGGYGMTPLSGASLPYFRITTKVVGPKNTVSYVQAFVY